MKRYRNLAPQTSKTLDPLRLTPKTPGVGHLVDAYERLTLPGAPPITVEALQKHDEKFGLVNDKKKTR